MPKGPFRAALCPILGVAATVGAQEPAALNPDVVQAPERGAAPVVACTAVELSALRRAYADGERVVVGRVESAARALGKSIVFPPRGGQHNQWYQCDTCQLGLRTVDPTHHECPKCAKVYSGPPYDDVVFSRIHGANLVRARESAWGFAVTEDERFARDAAAILSGYADRYEGYPYHTNARDPSRKSTSGGHIKEQTLSEASLMIGHVIPAFDLIWPALTAAERAHIADRLVLPMVENVAKCRRGKSNWQSFHNAAMFWGGAVLGDAQWMRRAVFDPKHGFLFQMEHCVSREGMWYENSWGYHLYTLRALVSLAEAARRCGIDLWAQPALRRMCSLPAQHAMADGSLPRFGDDVSSSPGRARALLEAAHAATGDPAIRSLLSEKISWESIQHGRAVGEPGVPARQVGAPPRIASAVFRDTGIAILRSRGEAGLTAAFTFGPFGGFHGHFDKLSFVWFGHGTELGVDPGRARSQAYRLPIHRKWYRGTIAHNAVVVDGRPQRGAAGELLLFTEGDGFVASAARCVAAYPGVAHSRCLILTDGYLVVLDRLEAESGAEGKARRFDWIYHNRGERVECAAAAGEAAAPLGLEGEEFLEIEGSGASEGVIRASFVGGKVTTRLLVAGASGSEVHRGHGVGASVLDRVPLLIVRRRGTTAQFAAVLEATTARHGGVVRDVRARSRDGGLEVEVQLGSSTDRFTWRGAALERSRPR